MSPTITCCLHCKTRFLGCHDVCPDYKEQRKQLDEYNAHVRQKHFEESLVPHGKAPVKYK